MEEFEHFNVCYFCTVVIQNEPTFSFVVPRLGQIADICCVCMGEIVNDLDGVNTRPFVYQRKLWETTGRKEEEAELEAMKADARLAEWGLLLTDGYERRRKEDEAFMEGQEWDEEQKRKLEQQAEDRDIYAL